METLDPVPSEIEVGASVADGTLRYWQAKEAVRQAESRLSAQAVIRSALEGRATAITGWAAATLLALAAAGATASDWPPRIAAGGAALLLFSAAAICIHAARPRNWGLSGCDPEAIMNESLKTELEILEAVGLGHSPNIRTNNIRLERMSRSLRWAGWVLISAPIVGAVIYAALSWAALRRTS